jgi:hypothetical protein
MGACRVSSAGRSCARVATFGPAVAAYAGAGDQVGTLDRAFLDFATRQNRGATDGPSEYHYEYRLVVATKG